MRSCIPGPSSTIPSRPLECHGRLPPSSRIDAIVPTASQLSQSTTSWDAAPDSVTIEITPTARTILTSVQTTQEMSKLDMNVKETDEHSSSSFSQESSTIALDAQFNSSSVVDSQTGIQDLADAVCDGITNFEGRCVVKAITETLDDMSPSDPSPFCCIPSGSYACQTVSSAPTCTSGSATIRPLMSIEVKPPAIPSLMSIATSPPPGWHNDYAFGPRYRYRHPTPRHRAASRPHRNTSSRRGGVRQTTPIPALKSIQNFPPPSGSSRDENSSSSFSRESSSLVLDAQSNSSSAVDSHTGTRDLADAICDGITNVEGSCIAKTITETLDEMSPSDPSPSSCTRSGSSVCQTVTSAPTSVSDSAAIRPLMSIEVKPPAIPSLMSIKTSPPPGWCNDYAFGPRYRYRHPMPRHSGASRPHRNTSSTRGGVRQTTPFPALMSIDTSPPVPYNGNRNNGNRRGMPAPSEIPSLMSIQTRPPWETRPPRGTRPSRGTRRSQAGG